MLFKKVEVTLKFPKCLLEKLLLAYVIVLLMLYNFHNHNIFISKNSDTQSYYLYIQGIW